MRFLFSESFKQGLAEDLRFADEAIFLTHIDRQECDQVVRVAGYLKILKIEVLRPFFKVYLIIKSNYNTIQHLLETNIVIQL